MPLTPEQEAAVRADGNVLVVAGAGTGKTRTLVERCLARIADPDQPAAIDRMLVVTFTEAAAAELRKRIRTRFEEWLLERPNDARLAEQLALLESARISTLHGFCLRLVRDRFYQLGIDPEVTVLSEEQAALVAKETLDAVLQQQYRGELGDAEALQQLLLDHGRGWDEPVRQMILRLHRYAQTLRDPPAWFESQRALLDQKVPAHWLPWLLEGFSAWRLEWLDFLREQPSPPARVCCAILEKLDSAIDRDQLSKALSAILAADDDAAWPKNQKTKLRKPLLPFFSEAAFLESLATVPGGNDPMCEDWNWLRKPTIVVLELARKFGNDFTAAKRTLGAVDFADLEQFALELLWDRAKNAPTATAGQLRHQLDLVFVDEYQDINEAQDTILRAVSREGADSNRFLVGDVKQSIYRFRLADPRIFQEYITAWSRSKSSGHVLHLAENFRSHEQILAFVNRLFDGLMRSEVGGVTYDPPQHLRFGAPEERLALCTSPGGAPRVELHLALAEDRSSPDAFDADNSEVRTQVEREAEMIGRRLQCLRADGFQVWDASGRATREVRWGDMAILMRSPRGKAEAYAKIFERLQIPLLVARGGFYESIEITDLLCVLRVLDNPLQDLPLLTVLHSPWVGLTPDELATIRLSARATYYWTALRQFHRQHPRQHLNAEPAIHEAHRIPTAAAAWPKVERFLAAYRTWRRRARQGSLSSCMESILDQTGYEAWLLAQPRGAQRQANVERLLALTRQFDEFQRQGLFRFLRFVEAQQAAGVDAEPAPPVGTDAVQLSSIHQSKGLEFPVVVVADLGKPWNLRDLHEPIILDDRFGLCPQIRPPNLGGRYPSLPHWLAQRRQKREMLGEELRLLYVAMTRACDLLLLGGSVTASRLAEHWNVSSKGEPSLRDLVTARCYLDWLGLVLPGMTGQCQWLESGTCPGFTWHVHQPQPPIPEAAGSSILPSGTTPDNGPPTPEVLHALEQRISWRYPFLAATLEPAKTSVSELRRRYPADEGEVVNWRPRKINPSMSGIELGVAHHLFLERLSLADAGELTTLRMEARRLAADGWMTTVQASALDLEAIASFWQSPVGMEIRAQADSVHRELPFTARFALEELAGLDLIRNDAHRVGLDSEWVIVQGAVDLAVIRDDQIWVLDFKTDQARDLAGIVESYRPQLQLYASALARIYSRPVSRLWLHSFAARQTVSLAVPMKNPG